MAIHLPPAPAVFLAVLIICKSQMAKFQRSWVVDGHQKAKGIMLCHHFQAGTSRADMLRAQLKGHDSFRLILVCQTAWVFHQTSSNDGYAFREKCAAYLQATSSRAMYSKSRPAACYRSGLATIGPSALLSENPPDAGQRQHILPFGSCISPGTTDKNRRQAWEGHSSTPAHTAPDF